MKSERLLNVTAYAPIKFWFVYLITNFYNLLISNPISKAPLLKNITSFYSSNSLIIILPDSSIRGRSFSRRFNINLQYS